MKRGSFKLPRWGTVLLATANAVGIWLCVARLWQGSEAASILATAPLPAHAPRPVKESEPAAEDLTAIMAAALFYQTRAFYTPPPVPQLQPPPDYKLSGTLVIPQQPTVALLIQGHTGARTKVREGDTLDGWKVASVQPQAVTVSHGEQQFEIRSTARTTAFGMRAVPLSVSPLRATRPAAAGVRLLGAPLPFSQPQ